MRLAHARPGDTLERFDGEQSHVIEIVAAFAGTDPQTGEPARFVDVLDDPGAAETAIRIRADTDPHDWRRVDHEADARAGFRALAGAGSVPPAPPLTEGQMIRAAADALGVKMISGIPGDDQPLPPGVTVRVVGAAARRLAGRRRS